MLVDTHCHVQVREFDGDRETVLARAAEAGVTTLICVGYDADSNLRAQQLLGNAVSSFGFRVSSRPVLPPQHAALLPRLYATAGLHPHDAKELTTEVLDSIRDLGLNRRIVAVGECGLDFYRNLSSPEQQRAAFIAQIELANEVHLPLVVHDREAHEEVVQLVAEHHARRGVMHCFSGDWELARRCLDLGFYISIAGPVTYKNPGHLLEVARRVPAERLIVETDSPYLSPHPYRGKRNEPARVRLVAEAVATLRGVEIQRFEEQLTANAKQLFDLA